jgi:hypothetical protein
VTRRHAVLTAATTAALLVAAAGCTTTTQGAPTPAPPRSSTPAPIPAPTSAGASATSGVQNPTASAPPMPTGTPGRPRGLPAATVDTTSADAVAEAFATTTFAYDTAIDLSVFDAQVRSAVYATPAFATELTTPLAQTGTAFFADLASHQGFTTVALATNADDGQPADALRSAARSYSVTTTARGSGGYTAPVDTTTVYVMLTRAGASSPWQVSSVSFGLGR